jgi:hypothetical protein
MALDSEGTFAERLCDRKLEAHLPHFLSLGWRTLNDLVYATTYTPQSHDEPLFEREIIIPGLGSPTHLDRPRLRRLFFEAFVLSASEMRRVAEGSPSDMSRVVPGPELEERRKRVELRQPSLLDADGFIEDVLDVSDKLIIRCITMYDFNKLAYLSLDLCTRRNFEMVGVTKEPALCQAPDASGYMKMKNVEPDDERAPLVSQFDVLYALQRRALAMEMGDLMSYEVHELLRRRLLGALETVPMPGFMPVSFDQIIQADQRIWQKLNKMSRGGIKRRGAAVRPLDALLPTVMNSMDIQLALMPRQGNVAPVPAQPANNDSAKLIAALQRQIDDVRKEATRASAIKGAFSGPSSPAAAQPKPKAGKNGKDKRNERKKGVPANPPPALAGGAVRSSNATGSVRMCFPYNLGTCKSKGDCSKGAHLCMKLLKSTGEACSRTDCYSSKCTRS